LDDFTKLNANIDSLSRCLYRVHLDRMWAQFQRFLPSSLWRHPRCAACRLHFCFSILPSIVDILQSIVNSSEWYRLTYLNSPTAYGKLAVTFKLGVLTNKKYTENLQSCIESM